MQLTKEQKHERFEQPLWIREVNGAVYQFDCDIDDLPLMEWVTLEQRQNHWLRKRSRRLRMEAEAIYHALELSGYHVPRYVLQLLDGDYIWATTPFFRLGHLYHVDVWGSCTLIVDLVRSQYDPTKHGFAFYFYVAHILMGLGNCKVLTDFLKSVEQDEYGGQYPWYNEMLAKYS
jgi:hypothetical protein